MTLERGGPLALAALTGAATVFGFAPFGVALLPIVTLSILFAQWRHAANAGRRGRRRLRIRTRHVRRRHIVGVRRARDVRRHARGDRPSRGTAGFIIYLSSWIALAGYVAARFTPRQSLLRLVAAAATWTLAEWGRSFGYPGFPWLSVGYAQLPGSPLAGYAPVGGVFVVSLAVALIASTVALVHDALAVRAWRQIAVAVALAMALFAGGGALARIEWTSPQGAPLTVSLVQGNVEQAQKFDPGYRARTFDLYARLVEHSHGRLIVLPESAFPMFSDEVPDPVLLNLIRTAGARNGDLLLGLFTAEAPLPGSDNVRYYNTVLSLGESDLQLYRKRHLVPFGESIPGKAVFGWLIRNVLAIPLADQTPGPAMQPPFEVAGARVAVNICYEDAFGAELIDAARSAAILINVTNDAWYGHSIAAWQHNQIATMRALELGRPMLRATNTGITSSIGHDGRVLAQLPWFTRGVLEVTVEGRGGATPYQTLSDTLAVGLALALFGIALAIARRR